MESPFIYDKYVTGKNFIGRKVECAALGNLLAQNEHVVLIEPPKSGKMSLIQQTLLQMRMGGNSFLAGQFSALNIRTVEEFVTRFGATVIRTSASTPAEYAELAMKYLGGTHLVFDPERFAMNEQLLSFNWDYDENDLEAVLRMPFAMARDLGTRIILIIDEFQNIDLIEDSDRIFAKMEKVIKEERSIGPVPFSFIFSGSMVNAMRDIFRTRHRFHRMVEILPLQPVNEREIADHVVKGFLSSGKVIDRDLLLGACRLFKDHLWYINHFVAICDSKSKGYIMEPVLVEALQAILSVHEPRFVSMMNSLTTHQVNLLKAILEGQTKFSSSEVVRQYKLNSSANVKRVKDALMKKEIVSFDDNDLPTILDPLFEYWVRRYYFEMKDV